MKRYPLTTFFAITFAITYGQFVGHGLSYSNIVLGAVAVVLVLVLGYRKLGAGKVTEPLDIPWNESEATSR
jgi:hypothetical protein